MQRNVRNRVVADLQALGQEPVAHWQVGLDLHPVDHDALVPVAADVVVAVTTRADAARQRLQAVERVERRNVKRTCVGLISFHEVASCASGLNVLELQYTSES